MQYSDEYILYSAMSDVTYVSLRGAQFVLHDHLQHQVRHALHKHKARQRQLQNETHTRTSANKDQNK